MIASYMQNANFRLQYVGEQISGRSHATKTLSTVHVEPPAT